MSALLGLITFAVLVSLAARRWLVDAPWTSRAPGLAIGAWQAVTFSIAGAIVLAGGALVLPLLHWSVDLAEVFRACVVELQHQYKTPAGAGLAVAGSAAAAALVTRFIWVFSVSQLHTWSRRRQMRDTLCLVGTQRPELGYVEVDHLVPLVYCLPGRPVVLPSPFEQREQVAGREVVVSTGAREVLTPAQLDGVLAHERAHLRARHDVAITAARALERTFFGLGIFALASERIAELAEMQADDAAQHGQRRDLAAALMQLGAAPTPQGAMGAGGATAIARIRRLAEPAAPLPRRSIAVVAGCVLVVLLVPMLLALVPTVLALFVDCCSHASTL